MVILKPCTRFSAQPDWLGIGAYRERKKNVDTTFAGIGKNQPKK
jgi:hypothetical protein